MATTAASELDRRPFFKRSRLREYQVSLFLRLMQELLEARRRAAAGTLSALPEYGRFIEGAYGCGFVTTDFATGDKLANGESYEHIKNRPQEVQYLPLQTVRHMVHSLVRAERSNFEMVDEKEGTINQALSNGLLAAIASRLEMILNER
jgi:hypothetical protein